jgi:hypothetical protein
LRRYPQIPKAFLTFDKRFQVEISQGHCRGKNGYTLRCVNDSVHADTNASDLTVVDFVAYRSDAGAHVVFEVAVFVLKGTLRRGKDSARQRDGSRFYAVFVDIDAKIAYPASDIITSTGFLPPLETPGPTSQTIPSSISSAILLDIVAEVSFKILATSALDIGPKS